MVSHSKPFRRKNTNPQNPIRLIQVFKLILKSRPKVQTSNRQDAGNNTYSQADFPYIISQFSFVIAEPQAPCPIKASQFSKWQMRNEK
jgi:hypothetical protein